MATRLYLQSTGAAPFSPAKADGGWEIDAAAMVYRNMRTAKANTALTTLSSVPGGTATQQYRYACFVSDTLASAQTISGTFSLVVGKCAETSTGGDAHLAYTLRVVDGTTGAHKALLAQVMTTSTEFPVMASAATRIHNGTAIASYGAAAGDRLVLEIGIHGVTPASETMQMRIGDPTASGDFALTAGLTTDLCPWGELSATLSFGSPPVNLPCPAPSGLSLAGFTAALAVLLVCPAPPGLTLEGLAPTLSITTPGITLACPAPSGMTLAPQAPSLGFRLAPGAASLAATGQAPALGVRLAAPSASLALSGTAPSLRTALATPSPSALALTGQTATIQIAATTILACPTPSALGLAGSAPALHHTLTTPPASMVLATLEPSIALTLTPQPGTLALVGETATLSIAAQTVLLCPEPVSLAITGTAPTLSTATAQALETDPAFVVVVSKIHSSPSQGKRHRVAAARTFTVQATVKRLVSSPQKIHGVTV